MYAENRACALNLNVQFGPLFQRRTPKARSSTSQVKDTRPSDRTSQVKKHQLFQRIGRIIRLLSMRVYVAKFRVSS
jgi:hypothetical protein